MRTFGKARGMQVITIAEGASVGKLDDVYFDLEHHRIYGYRIKGSWMWSATAACAADQVQKLGRDAILIKNEAGLEKAGGRTDDDARSWAGDFVGRKIMSRRGEQLGEVSDLVLDEANQLVRAALTKDDRLVKFDGRVALGRDAVIVDDTTVPIALGDEKIESPEWWTKLGGLLG